MKNYGKITHFTLNLFQYKTNFENITLIDLKVTKHQL